MTNIFKVKKEKLNILIEWGNEIETRLKEEATETLKEEGLIYESCGFFKLGEDYYVVATSIGEHKPTNYTKEINQKHKKVKEECLEKVAKVEKIYELFNK